MRIEFPAEGEQRREFGSRNELPARRLSHRVACATPLKHRVRAAS
jgi:hypothetical protein